MTPWRRRLVFGSLGLGLLSGTAIGLGVWAVGDLPSLQSFADYAPMQSSKVRSADGALLGEFFSERRTVVPFSQIPMHVVHAFLAAEDANFYQHEGIDYFGILRALFKNMRPGAHLQGASTITQQTVKTLVLGPQRSYLRKIREAYLARQMEQVLHKNDILALYLNQIYFGNGAMGIESASQLYFGRSVRSLDLGEAALLAAIPKNPARYTLRADPVATKQRQSYVLDQMLRQGWADAAAVEEQKARKLPYPASLPPAYHIAPYYLEHVRRQLVDRFGETRLLQGGLQIRLAMDSQMQAAGLIALRQGLEDVALRLGDWQPKATLKAADLGAARSGLRRRLRQLLERRSLYRNPPQATHGFLWNLAPAVGPAEAVSVGELQRSLDAVALQPFARVTGLVLPKGPGADGVRIDLGSQEGFVPQRSLSWLRKRLGKAPGDSGAGAGLLRPGDLVEVEVARLSSAKRPIELRLVPNPTVQGALIAMHPASRAVCAMVGGIPADVGGFNRATQALRQPGSVFKPVLYASALQSRTITPASLCADSPVVIVDPWTGKAWRPENYESGRYDGNLTYRQALVRSKNTCSVKLIQRLGPQPVIDMAHALGIRSPMPQNLTLALGTGDTTVQEICEVYATLAAGGQWRPPVFILDVHDAAGRLLFAAADLPGKTALQPNVAYVLTHMLESVVQQGTAARARQLDRPLAGKTGTSQKSRTLWFSGYAPQLAATVYMGYDNNAPVGGLTGASAALPAWIRFMGMALAGEPPLPFIKPPGVIEARVDPSSGTSSQAPDSLLEEFVAGTEPGAVAADSPYLVE
jgi:penicillin-binding protein 1A